MFCTHCSQHTTYCINTPATKISSYVPTLTLINWDFLLDYLRRIECDSLREVYAYKIRATQWRLRPIVLYTKQWKYARFCYFSQKLARRPLIFILEFGKTKLVLKHIWKSRKLIEPKCLFKYFYQRLCEPSPLACTVNRVKKCEKWCFCNCYISKTKTSINYFYFWFVISTDEITW